MGRGSQPEALQLFEPEPGQLYSLDVAAYLAGVSRRSVLLYCKAELIRPAFDAEYGGFLFDETAVRTIRRAERLQKLHGMDLTGVRMVLDLLDQVESLRQELRFHRGH
jgi:MerR family transcriptional regulator/heat shock protein HspR